MRISAIFLSILFISNGWAHRSSKSQTSIYEECQQRLKQGSNLQLYRYGAIKPRDLKEAFCVFLAVDDKFLEEFKKCSVDEAVSYALNPITPFGRFDWGCEGFQQFSNFCIKDHNIYAPKSQYEFAFRIFHFWMNQKCISLNQEARRIRQADRNLNKEWKIRYQKHLMHVNNEHLKGALKIKYQRELRRMEACEE